MNSESWLLLTTGRRLTNGTLRDLEDRKEAAYPHVSRTSAMGSHRDLLVLTKSSLSWRIRWFYGAGGESGSEPMHRLFLTRPTSR